jgi:hypothetical protein
VFKVAICSTRRYDPRSQIHCGKIALLSIDESHWAHFEGDIARLHIHSGAHRFERSATAIKSRDKFRLIKRTGEDRIRKD